MMYYGWGMGPFGWAWMGLMTLFWIAVLVTLIVVAVRLTARRDGSGTALEILKQRLARGDITPDEYERDRQLLTR